MKFTRRRDADTWIRSGGCPFYFYPLSPRCAVIRMALSGKDIFDDDIERASISENDCGGDMHSCPFVNAMWDIEADVVTDQDTTFTISDPDLSFDISDGALDPDYSVIIIPTTRLGQWRNMGYDHGWNDETGRLIDAEIAMYESPFELGSSFITRGMDTGYFAIIHAVVFDDINGGGISPRVIQSAIISSLREVERTNSHSVEIRPMCIPLPDGGSFPDTWHMVALPVTSVLSIKQAGGLSSCDRIRIDINEGGAGDRPECDEVDDVKVMS